MSNNKWQMVIGPQRHMLDINVREIWEYRDLLYMFIKRDIITIYKQTIFGPIWFIVQPLLTMIVFIVIFSNIAKISTDGIPPPLFYLTGIIIWNYFHECFKQTSDTFLANSYIFGKVYFPRIIIPLSKVISSFIKSFIQSILLIVMYVFYLLINTNISINEMIVFIPIYVVLMAGLGMGFGMIFTSITSKYRDLNFVITYGIQLLMYLTPVIYPVSILPDKYKQLMFYNPVSHIIEGTRYGLLNSGNISTEGIIYSVIFTTIIFITGVLIFNKSEQTFIDTI